MERRLTRKRKAQNQFIVAQERVRCNFTRRANHVIRYLNTPSYFGPKKFEMFDDHHNNFDQVNYQQTMAPSLPASASEKKAQTLQVQARQEVLTRFFKPAGGGGSTPNNHNNNYTSRVSKSKPTPRKSKSKSNKPKSSTATNDGDDDDDDDGQRRIKTDVLVAIKPIHLANIVSREKNHEYRKYRLSDEVVRLWLYETKEGGQGRAAITHIAVIPEGIRRTPGTVPAEPFGIGNDDFNAGLKVSKYGYPVLEVYELVEPVTLAEMRSKWGMGAPMGWRYVCADLWRDRWGEVDDDDERTEKVTRVF